MKTILFGIGIVVIAIAGFAFYQSTLTVATNAIDANRTISGNYVVAAEEKLVVKNGAILTIEGTFELKGTIACEGKALRLVLKNPAKIDGRLECTRSEGVDAEGDAPEGISIVAEKGIAFSRDAVIVSNAHVQIADASDKLRTTEPALRDLFDETGANTGTGPRIGPLAPGPGSEGTSRIETPQLDHREITSGAITKVLANLLPNARAEGAGGCIDQNGNVVPGCTQISGKWMMGNGGNPPPGVIVPTPPPGVSKIILNFNFGPGQEVHVVNFNLSGPDGRNGTGDTNTNCNARGADGEDAFRLRLNASNITVNNFNVWLGHGGNGGDAETTQDCDPGTATGGKGGQAGNLKISGSDSINIEGAFNIYPGESGNGGDATAHGMDGANGCPGKKGGDATARGGASGANKKDLSVAGSVTGTSNIVVDEVRGGNGGLATADPGMGGNGTACGCAGGGGGNGTAIGGKGGDASLKVLSASGSATGGNGGDADSHGARGGAGGSCGPEGPGGSGGKGGDALSNKGRAGTATSANGSDGNVKDETGGNGGNGGDGCNEGKGGKGGKGNPNGKDGSLGNNTCIKSTAGTTLTPPPASELPPPAAAATGGGLDTNTPPPPAAKQTIHAIRYQGKYLPRDQLIIEDETGCGADHWHAAEGFVKATDGSNVPDPGPQCGYGKVNETPLVATEIQ